MPVLEFLSFFPNLVIRLLKFCERSCLCHDYISKIDVGFPFTAIAAEQDALQQKNNVHKLQEAKVAANKYEDLASQKRQRAQMLMENADLATYKAMMALRIAEAAEADETPERAVPLFLDWNDGQ